MGKSYDSFMMFDEESVMSESFRNWLPYVGRGGGGREVVLQASTASLKDTPFFSNMTKILYCSKNEYNTNKHVYTYNFYFLIFLLDCEFLSI